MPCTQGTALSTAEADVEKVLRQHLMIHPCAHPAAAGGFFEKANDGFADALLEV